MNTDVGTRNRFRRPAAWVTAGVVVAAMVMSPEVANAGATQPADEVPLVELALPPDANSSTAAAINNEGTVVGAVGIGGSLSLPVKWDDRGRITILPTMPGSASTSVSDIDERGVVFGYWYDEAWTQHAMLWDRTGRIVPLTPLAPGPTWIADSNTAGTYVGSSVGPDGKDHAVKWDSCGRVTDLGMLPGANRSSAGAINDAGVIVGSSDVADGQGGDKAVLWDRYGRIHELAPTGALDEEAIAVNDAGMILGATAGLMYERGVVRWDRHGRLTDLGLPFGMMGVYAVGLNERGTIIGTGFWDTTSGLARGVRWDRRDRPIELPGLTTTDGTEVAAVNDHDVIIGGSRNTNGVTAVYWDRAGAVHPLATWHGSTWNNPVGINDNDVVAGFCVNYTLGTGRAVIWRIGATE